MISMALRKKNKTPQAHKPARASPRFPLYFLSHQTSPCPAQPNITSLHSTSCINHAPSCHQALCTCSILLLEYSLSFFFNIVNSYSSFRCPSFSSRKHPPSSISKRLSQLNYTFIHVINWIRSVSPILSIFFPQPSIDSAWHKWNAP